MALSIHMTDDKVLSDPEVCDLIGELGSENLNISIELVRRVVTICNLNVWEELLAEHNKSQGKRSQS